MNLEKMPSSTFDILQTGYLSIEWQNFFSMNNEQLRLYFADSGHLLPSLTNNDVLALNNASISNNTLFKARSLYNNDTNNFMGNVNGVYLNYTMHDLSSRASILNTTFNNDTIQYLSDENNNLYGNINGTVTQLPKLNNPEDGVLNFELDASGNVYVNVDGVVKQIQTI